MDTELPIDPLQVSANRIRAYEKLSRDLFSTQTAGRESVNLELPRRQQGQAGAQFVGVPPALYEVAKQITEQGGGNDRATLGNRQDRRTYFLDTRVGGQKPPTACIYGSEQILFLPQQQGRQTFSHLRSIGRDRTVYLPDQGLTVEVLESLGIGDLNIEIMKRMPESLGEEVVCGANDDAVTVSRHTPSLAARERI